MNDSTNGYIPTDEERSRLKYQYLGGWYPWSPPDLEWELIAAAHTPGDVLCGTAAPTLNSLTDALINQTRGNATIDRDAQTYLTKTGAKNAKHFAKKLKENLKQRQLDRLGKADPSIATLMPSFQGGQPFSVQLEPTWDQFYKAGLYVTDGFESHYTYNYPSEPRSIVLSNGSIARGSLPIHNIDDQGRGQSGVFRAMSGLGERGGYNPVNMKEVRSFNESLNSFVSHPQPVPSSAQGVVTAWDEGRQVPVTVRCEISLASWEDARAVSGICDVPLFNKQREERQSQRTVGGSAGSSRN